MTNSSIDYINTQFEYPTLTRIHGQPNYPSLKIIKDEMKANASSVMSDLGGGANGHLGIMLTQLEYSSVSPTDYIKPLHPGALVIAAGTSQHESTRLREDHKEDIRQYRETTAIEQSLVKQLGQALPELYLRSFRNIHTNTITTDIPTLLTHLFTTYGAIESEELQEKAETLRQKVFDISQPLIIMFNKVDELQELATASGNPFTPRQLTEIGIQLIKNFNDFEKGLTTWFDLPTPDQTWPRFKIHFETARTSLRKVRGVTMRNTAYHQQANAMTGQVLQEIRAENLQLVDEVKSAEGNILRAMLASENQENINPQQTQSANATMQTTLQTEMMKTLQAMQKEIAGLKQEIHNSKNGGGAPSRASSKARNKKPRTIFSKYCWTHGAWHHNSRDCKFKAEGHKDTATFVNRMGGSNESCPPVTE